MQLMTPALVEVYTASIAVNIRALTAILKAASFLEPDELWNAVEVCDQLSQNLRRLNSVGASLSWVSWGLFSHRMTIKRSSLEHYSSWNPAHGTPSGVQVSIPM
jgi:hypothetical protein